MRNFNITVAFENGTYSHTQNAKAENEKDAIKSAIDDHFKKDQTILSVTVIEMKY